MKYFLSVISIFFLMVGCFENADLMHLSGHVKGLKKGTLILQKIEDTSLVSIDSVLINGNSDFEFSEEIESPQLYYLYLRLIDGTLIDDRIPFFAESGEIIINTTLTNFEIDARISGSKNEVALEEYKKLVGRYTRKNLELIEGGLKALQKGNDSLATSMKIQQESLMASKYLMTVNFALNHSDYELAPYLMLSEVFDSNIKYLDTVYKKLSPKIKDSKYGKALESYIVDRKGAGN